MSRHSMLQHNANEGTMGHSGVHRMSWMGESKAMTTLVSYTNESAEGRAKARQRRAQQMKEIRQTLTKINDALGFAPNGEDRTQSPARHTDPKSPSARPTWSESVVAKDGATLLASYLDGTLHRRGELEEYNEFVRNKMVSIMKAKQHEEGAVPAELPDAKDFAPPKRDVSAATAVTPSSPKSSRGARSAARCQSLSQSTSRGEPESTLSVRGYNTRAGHQADQLLAYSAFKEVNFAKLFKEGDNQEEEEPAATAATAQSEPSADAQQVAMVQFMRAFAQFCREKDDELDMAHFSALLKAFGVEKTPEELSAICADPPSGPKQPCVAQSYVADAEDMLAPPPAPGQAWTASAKDGIERRLAKTGVAYHTYTTIEAMMLRAVETAGDSVALRVEKPGAPADGPGEWVEYTWKEYHAQCVKFAKALMAVGHEANEAVTICGFNHPVWFFAHLGANIAGGMSAGTYATNSPEACAFVFHDSGARVAVVDTVAQMKKYIAAREAMPKLSKIVVWMEAVPADVLETHGDLVCSIDDFMALGENITDAQLDERRATIHPMQCSSLIYTSGTTGSPKGVMISHDNVLYSAEAVLQTMDLGTDHWQLISYLPMSHIAAQAIDIFIPMILAGVNGKKVTVNCARPDVLKGSLLTTLRAVRPTMFFGVPRVWEKLAEGIKAKSRADPPQGIKKQLMQFAAQVGREGCHAKQHGGSGELPYGYAIAQKAVHAKVAEGLGLDRCESCATGAAPITRETLEFLGAMGIEIHEVYGMSETTGMGTFSNRNKFKFGSCGTRTVTMELKTEHVEGRDKEGEGEICFRGRHVMMGYLNNPEKTREVIDEEGWMHSGDVGRIDEAGCVYITGRIKELIIGAGGENIAPVPIESELKRLMPALSNVVMVGDKRKYNTMLVTLKSKPDLDTGAFFDELIGEALEVNPEVTTVSGACTDAKWNEYIQKGIDEYNSHALSNAQKIQKFRILPQDLSLPGGELTSTLKLRRNVVTEKYAAVIDSMYGADE